MRNYPSYMVIILSAIAMLACGNSDSDLAANTVAVNSDQNKQSASAKPKPDMKKTFGPNYKKGDVGHAFGTVKAIALDDGKSVEIEHGVVHGTALEPNTSVFEVLDNADVTTITPDNRVEFLVWKGDDDVYRLYSICALEENVDKCL